MLLEREIGGWTRQNVRFTGSFRINGTSTPDDLCDGNSNCIASVARVSAGLFTVTLHEAMSGQVPQKPFIRAELQQAAAPTVWARAHVVVDSWSQSARTFQVQVLTATAADDTAPAASDADDNDVVQFEMSGSISSAGTD